MSNNPLVSILLFIDNEELIRDIIENEIIEIYFQPIISFRTNSIYGFEALTRCTYKNNKISPFLLFKLAKEYNLLIELDKLIRLKSIKKFESSSKQLGETITKSIANYEVKASIDGEEHYLKEYY